MRRSSFLFSPYIFALVILYVDVLTEYASLHNTTGLMMSLVCSAARNSIPVSDTQLSLSNITFQYHNHTNVQPDSTPSPLEL